MSASDLCEQAKATFLHDLQTSGIMNQHTAGYGSCPICGSFQFLLERLDVHPSGSHPARKPSIRMCSPTNERLRLALLIDGDNVSPYYAEELVSKAVMQGDVTIRQVFGDFLLQENTPWDAPAPQALGIEPVQVNRCHQGSNSTDLALIARAEALAKTDTLDGICVASSDGDFVCLANLLKAANKLFLVVAPLLASRKLVEVCDRYIALDGDYQPPNQSGFCSRQLWLLTNAIAMHTNKEGWAKLSAVSSYLRCHSPSYAQNKWGYRTLTKLLIAVGCFEVRKYHGGQMRTRRITRSDTTPLPMSSVMLPFCQATNGEFHQNGARLATSK